MKPKVIVDSRGPLYMVLKGFVNLGRFVSYHEAALCAGLHMDDTDDVKLHITAQA